MSASSASRALRLGQAAACALFLCALAAIPTAFAKTAPRDSDRVVRRVTVSDNGIEIEHSGDDDAATPVVIRHAHHDSLSRHIEISSHSGLVTVDGDEAGLVRVFADAEVPAGQRIEGDVVAVFGSVVVRGQVSGNVVAVAGSVKLEPGASVDGDAVAVGGVLDQAEGARVGGESVSLGFLPLRFGVPTVPILLVFVIGGWLLTLFVGMLLTLVAPDRMVRIAATSSRRTGLSLLLGLVSFPGSIVAWLLLLITVVGIPVAILLPIVYGVMIWAGQIAASYVVGCKLLRRRFGEGSAMGPIAAGSLFVALFFIAGAVLASPPGIVRTFALFFSALGGLMVFGLSAIGTGAVLVSRFGTEPADLGAERGTHAAPAMPAGAMPPPSTA